MSEHGSGSVIYLMMKKQTVPIEMIASWILIERQGLAIKSILSENFTEIQTLEHFQTFYRFKVSSNISLGKVFGLLEESKQALRILQYSVKQTSLEQVFNYFASQASNVHMN